MFLFGFLFLLLGVLLSLAFFTLLERKVMAFFQYRKGPSKVLIFGLLQPMADAMKLLTKEIFKINSMKVFYFFMGPFIMLLVMLMSWGGVENVFLVMEEPKILVLFSILMLGVYGVLFMGFGSNSKYPLICVYRVLILIMSFEVVIFILVLCLSSITQDSMSYFMMWKMQEGCWMLFFSFYFTVLLMISLMSELNRPPFDMSESESELVSGVFTEYMSGLFALLFIAEYGMMTLMGFFISLILFGGLHYIILKSFFFAFFLVWARCVFPRIRYDVYLMNSWKLLVPLSLFLFLLVLLFI